MTSQKFFDPFLNTDVLSAARLNLALGQLDKAIGDSSARNIIARVSLSATQAIPSSVHSAINWSQEDEDTDGMFTVTSTDITIQTAGRYVPALYIRFESNSTGLRIARIRLNGSRLVQANKEASFATDMSIFVPVRSYLAGDVFTVTAWQDTGSSLEVDTDTIFSVYRLGA